MSTFLTWPDIGSTLRSAFPTGPEGPGSGSTADISAPACKHGDWGVYIGFHSAGSGERRAASGERRADLRAMDVALGLGHARTDLAEGVGPIIEGDYSPILRQTFAPLADTTLTEFLASVDSERLRRTTRDLSAFAQSLAAASLEFDRTLAKDAFGFRRAARLARSDRVRQAQTGLMWTLILEKSAAKFYDLGAMAQLFDAATKSAQEFPRSDVLPENSRRPNFRRGPLRKPIK